MEMSNTNQELIEIIRAKLDLSDSAIVKNHVTYSNIEVDLIIEDFGKKYFIELKSKARVESIARFVLLRELLKTQNVDLSSYFFVIVSKIIQPDVANIAKQVDVKIITIPRNFGISMHKYDKLQGKTKITSEKAWKIISRLLKEKFTSIRQLSIKENVSYGWAHATIQSLIYDNIVAKKGNYVSITDSNKLLNGVAWERPFENLLFEEIYIGYDDAFKAAQDISHMLKEKAIKFAFTSYTAGGLYTGYAVRHDSIYMYIDKNDSDYFIKTFEGTEKQGIRARIYKPDRDIFQDTRDKEGVQVVSPSQTLLDLAGLGYSGRDIAINMVEKYATI